MIKIILSIIFAGISIASFVFYTKPLYIEQQNIQTQLRRYENALAKARAASARMDLLASARNNIQNDLRDKLNVMVPVNAVDNIQLILDIEGIANKYNVLLKQVDISKSGVQETNSNKQNSLDINVGSTSNNLIKNLEVSFAVEASYNNFLNFLLDLEHNLRIVDIVELSIDAESRSTGADVFQSGLQDNAGDQQVKNIPTDKIYTFNIVLRTYWIEDK